jgi:hypothetical protein
MGQADDSAEPGLPFVRPVVRQLTEELLRDQSQWKTAALVERIVQLHRTRGGGPVKNPAMMVRRVLQDLRAEGAVIAPGHGWWRWTVGLTDSETAANSSPNLDTSASMEGVVEDIELERSVQIEKEVGAGSECVYLYFNPNDRRLAELEGRDTWECKIGRTGTGDAIARVLGQGITTALSRLPTVGLILRTDDSAALERALHSALRLAGATVPESPGSEWFRTSPTRVEAWFAGFQEDVERLRLK